MEEDENTFPMDFYLRPIAPAVEVPARGLPRGDPH